MIKNFIFIVVIWITCRFIFNLDFAERYEIAIMYLSENNLSLLAYGTIGSIIFVVIAYFLQTFGFYSVMLFFCKFIFEISQFMISFISVSAVVFFYQIQRNLWLDINLLSIVPFEMLAASCLCLHLFDFNYPLRDKILDNIGVPILSGVIVIFSSIL